MISHEAHLQRVADDVLGLHFDRSPRLQSSSEEAYIAVGQFQIVGPACAHEVVLEDPIWQGWRCASCGRVVE